MPTSFLTQEGHDKLQNELDQLRGHKRKEIADRLHEAIEGGDLIENAEYEAAKNEQAFVEGRIKELEILLANARIVDDSEPVDEVQVGATVTIQEGDLDPEVYDIVGAAEADPINGRISNESPLGDALLDHRAGDNVVVEAPDGAYEVVILKVE